MNESEQSFEFSDGSSNKFWTIKLDGKSYTVHYGRIGTAGQTQVKDFASEQVAEKEYEKIIAEKLKKGYKRTGGQPSSAKPVSTASSTTQTTSSSSGGSAPAAKAPAPTPQPVAASTPASTTAATAVATAPAALSAPAHAPVAPAAKESQPKIAFDPNRERKVHLTTNQWLYAFWRRKSIAPRLEPRAFDIDVCLKECRDILRNNYGDFYGAWSNARTSPQNWSRQEGHFWLEALATSYIEGIQRTYFPTPAAFDAKMANFEATMRAKKYGSITAKDVSAMMQRGQMMIHDWSMAYPLVAALDLEEYFNAWGSVTAHLEYYHAMMYRAFVLPCITDEELARLRLHVSRNLKDWDTCKAQTQFAREYHFAAMHGMHDELLPVIESWSDDMFLGRNNAYAATTLRPDLIIFGLKDPDLVEKHFRRLQLDLRTEEDMYAWIAHTGWNALDLARKGCDVQDKETAEKRINILGLVEAPETVPHMFDLYVNSPVPQVARKWIDQRADLCIEPLLQLAEGNGPLASTARGYLRDLSRKADTSKLSDQAQEALRQFAGTSVDSPKATAKEPPAWLGDAFKLNLKGKRGSLPSFVDHVAYDPVVIDGWQLSDDQLAQILLAMKQSSFEAMHPLITAIREHNPGAAFDDFLWDVFGRWKREGYPAKEKWAMHAIGMLGSSQKVLSLFPMMVEWREENQTGRAFWGLEAMRFCGSDMCLMKIHDISQSPKLKSMRAKALEHMVKIAEEKGLSKQELEDRIVPTCGLNEQGTRVFDFGARKFTFAFGPDLKPSVRDEDGKLKTDLPGVTQKDDQELANQAVADWKELKKNLKTVAKVQASRLELAMVTGRTWPVQDFETLLRKHPLMSNLIRLVVWGALDQSGKLLKTFRITEENKFADENDKDITLDDVAGVKILHPMHMTDAQKAAWGEVFSDYEIIPLFPQIGRSIYKLEPDELTRKNITRFANIKVPAISLTGTLEKLGWMRGKVIDGPVYTDHYKNFYDSNLTAVVEYEGIMMMMALDSEPQSIHTCYFVKGIIGSEYVPQEAYVPLSEVDPVVVSEVLSDLILLTSKGKEEED